MRQESERHTEDVHVFRIEKPGIGIDLIGGAAKATANHLLAEKLTGEGPETHDVRHGFCVPALREHADRYHVLNLLTRLAPLTDGVNPQA